MDASALIVSIATLIGVLTTLVVGIGTFLKYRAEAKKISVPVATLDPVTAKYVTDITNSLLENCRDEIRSLREDNIRLSDDQEASVDGAALMKVEIAAIRRDNRRYVRSSRMLIDAVRTSIETRNELINGDCIACRESDKALLVCLERIKDNLRRGEDVDKTRSTE